MWEIILEPVRWLWNNSGAFSKGCLLFAGLLCVYIGVNAIGYYLSEMVSRHRTVGHRRT